MGHRLAYHDHAVRGLTCRGTVRELGDVLADRSQILEAALVDDCLLMVLGSLARLGSDLIPCRAFQGGVRIGRQLLGQTDEIGVCIKAQDEAYAIAIPAIEVLGLREVRVAAERDLAEPGPAAQADRTLEV